MVCNLWFTLPRDASRAKFSSGNATHAHRCPLSVRSRYAIPVASGRQHPFHTAEEAWLWTMAALIARREGADTQRGKAWSAARASRTTWSIAWTGCTGSGASIWRMPGSCASGGNGRWRPSLPFAAERFDYRLWTRGPWTAGVAFACQGNRRLNLVYLGKLSLTLPTLFLVMFFLSTGDVRLS